MAKKVKTFAAKTAIKTQGGVSGLIDLNTGHRYAIKGNAVHGYVVTDTESDDQPVYHSEFVQDCHTWRAKHA